MSSLDDNKRLFFDMQEHPENYSDDQLETMMDELDQVPDVDAAWQRLEVRGERIEKRTPFGFQLRKIAAAFIGAIIVSAIAIAAIHLWNPNSDSNPKGENPIPTSPRGEDTYYPKEKKQDVLQADTLIFDNVPLDTMLREMADYYHVSVEFKREKARQLRFHFVWKHSESLDHVVERLNNFEAVNIVREPEKLIVR